MFRKIVPVALSLCIAFASVAAAQDATKKALASIPADAIAFVIVPSIATLDADYQRFINDLGLQMFVQPPLNSIPGLLGQFMQMSAGLDTNGTLAVVIMPAEQIFELPTKIALLVPATDPKALLEAMGGQTGEGGVWSVTVQGQPWSAVITEGRAVLSPSPDVAKAIVASKTGIDTKIKKSELAALKDLDVALWIDGSKLLSMFKPQIDGLLGMMALMQQSAGAMGTRQAEATKQQVDLLVNGLESGVFGVSLDAGGVGLRFAMTAKPGSDLAKQLTSPKTSGSLLRGLPGDKYLLAFGQAVDPAQTKEALKSLDPYFAMADEIEDLDKEQFARLKPLIEEWAGLIRGIRVSVGATTAGEDGMFRVNGVLETTDSQATLKTIGEIIEVIKNVASVEEDFKEIVDAVTYSTDTEEINGLKVHQLKIDIATLAEAADMDEEDIAAIGKVIGKEGLLFRLAAAGGKTVVLGFGGGAKYMGTLLEQAQSGNAPLDSDAGIQKVSSHLPSNRHSVMYIAVDRIVACVGEVMKVLDEDEPFPLRMPEINSPLAAAGSGGKGWTQFDLFLPTELIDAGKNAAMMMMMGMGQPGATDPRSEDVRPDVDAADAPTDEQP